MKNGFRWTTTGGILGLILLALGSIVYYYFIKMLPPSKFNWSLALSIAIPTYSGVLYWAVKVFDQKNKKEIDELNEKIDKKADKAIMDTEMALFRQSLEDHKSVNDTQIRAINNQFVTMQRTVDKIDTKVDKILDKLIEK